MSSISIDVRAGFTRPLGRLKADPTTAKDKWRAFDAIRRNQMSLPSRVLRQPERALRRTPGETRNAETMALNSAAPSSSSAIRPSPIRVASAQACSGPALQRRFSLPRIENAIVALCSATSAVAPALRAQTLTW